MKKLFVFALFIAAGWMAWRYWQAPPSAAKPVPRNPTPNPAATPANPILAQAPRVLDDIFGQATVRAGEAPAREYDPDYVRWTFSQDTPEPEDYLYSGIY